MTFKPIETASLTELFTEQLEEKIFSGELKPGDRLPPEREIAKEMRISQTIVNNGFAILAGRGLLKIVPRKGTYVADYLNESGLEALAAMGHYTSRHLSDPAVADLYRFRLACECSFFQEASLKMTDEDRAELTRYFQNVKDAVDDREAFAENWYQVIRFLSVKSGNRVYRMIINGFRQLYIAVFDMLYRHAALPDYFLLTDRVFQALIEGNLSLLYDAILKYQKYEQQILEESRFFDLKK